jgi:tripeptidyl-peptidase I
MCFSVLAFSTLVAGAIAAPAVNAKKHVIHEKRDVVPVDWRRNAKLHPDSKLPMRIAHTQSNLDKADEFLMEVSHPQSPNFGKALDCQTSCPNVCSYKRNHCSSCLLAC